jgi:hypothetical protein
MVTRNRFLAWPSVVFGINSLINQHPLRQKESAAGWSNTGCVFICLPLELELTLSFSRLCIVALFASYFPYFVVTKNPIV